MITIEIYKLFIDHLPKLIQKKYVIFSVYIYSLNNKCISLELLQSWHTWYFSRVPRMGKKTTSKVPRMGRIMILLIAEIRLTTWDAKKPANDGINMDKLPTSTGSRMVPSTVSTRSTTRPWAQLLPKHHNYHAFFSDWGVAPQHHDDSSWPSLKQWNLPWRAQGRTNNFGEISRPPLPHKKKTLNFYIDISFLHLSSLTTWIPPSTFRSVYIDNHLPFCKWMCIFGSRTFILTELICI